MNTVSEVSIIVSFTAGILTFLLRALEELSLLVAMKTPLR